MAARVCIDPADWRLMTGDRSWLKLELVVNGVSMHLDAVEVLSDGEVQEGRGELASALAAVHDAVAADGPWRSLFVEGREYALIATPFC